MAQLIYDGDCPFCSNYVDKLRLEQSIGGVELINVRLQPQLAVQLRAQGYNLDQGMLLEVDGNYYFGEDALHHLALLSTANDFFNRLNRWLFSIHWLAAVVYPLLRLGRNTTLLLLGRRPVNTENQQQKAFSILFSLVWASFSILHVFVYSFQYGKANMITSLGIGICAVTLLLKPQSRVAFTLLLLVSGVSAILQMPVSSNHSIIKHTFLLAALCLGVYHSLRGHSWALFIQQLSYVGRALILIMYFYGVLHKINSDFLNPDVSCAVALWHEMPAFISWLDFTAIHYLTIYGTLIGETAIAVCLLLPRWRHLGIVGGMTFHALLGLSGYAMYPPFSTLCIALHCCFLTPTAAKRILAAKEWQLLHSKMKTIAGAVFLAVLLFGLFATAWIEAYSTFGLIWLVLVTPLIYAVSKYGSDTTANKLSADKGSYFLVSLMAIAFFINGLTPYLGLKTAQSINMFANLRLEAGISNHLIFNQPPGPWQYLDDVVVIKDAGGIAPLEYAQLNGLGIVYYQLLHYLQLYPGHKVDFVRNQYTYLQQSADSLHEDIERILHPLWVRKLFHFNVVDFRTPKPCALDR